MLTALGTARAIEDPQAVCEKDWIDVKRACRIVGVSWPTLSEMGKKGHIEFFNYRNLNRGKRAWRKVSYQSVVDFCERLRSEYLIPDLRPKLSSPLLRHRDEALLPFPLRDTVGMPEAMMALGFNSPGAVASLIDEGCFWAYRLRSNAPWRICASSLRTYLDRVLKGMAGGRLPADYPRKIEV